MHWSTSPRLTLPPYWNRTIVSPFLAMKMKEVKTSCILSHSLDSECATDLQEVLKMSIGILRGLAAEWALLHHVDESQFKFEAIISDVHFHTGPDVGTGWS
jgi:hypothetical protein